MLQGILPRGGRNSHFKTFVNVQRIYIYTLQNSAWVRGHMSKGNRQYRVSALDKIIASDL